MMLWPHALCMEPYKMRKKWKILGVKEKSSSEALSLMVWMGHHTPTMLKGLLNEL